MEIKKFFRTNMSFSNVVSLPLHTLSTIVTPQAWGVRGNGWGLSFQEETSYTYTLTLYYSRISILYKKNKNKNVIPLNTFIYLTRK